MGDLRGRRRAQTLVGLLVGLAVAAAGGGARAESVDETGYWWRFQPAEGSPATPPGVGPGQLYVAADAAGISAVAAVRVEVGSARVVALALTEAASSGAPTLRACPTSGWTKTNGAGPLRNAPSLDRCAGEGVPGTKAGTVWTFPVGDLVHDGVLDVAIATGVEAQSVTFASPGVDAVRMAPPTATAAEDDRDEDAEPAPVVAAAPPPLTSAEGGNAFALDALSELPSSGLAAEVPALPLTAFDDDVAGLPTPPRRSAPVSPGRRSPLALLAAAIVVGTWAWRANAAVGAAGAHPLFGPLRFSQAALAGAGRVLTSGAGDGDGPDATRSTRRRRSR